MRERRRPSRGWSRTRLRRLVAMALLGGGAVAAAAAVPGADARPITLGPVYVESPMLLGPMVVGAPPAASRPWRHRRARNGEPVGVELTAYCLRGTTRRGRYVRGGIVAADPTIFPLSRYVELFVDGRYLGRYLVDDTGAKIRGRHIDVWKSTCAEALRFGHRRGTAVLVPRPPRP